MQTIIKTKSRLWCVGTKNGRREYSIQRISIPAFNFTRLEDFIQWIYLLY